MTNEQKTTAKQIVNEYEDLFDEKPTRVDIDNFPARQSSKHKK